MTNNKKTYCRICEPACALVAQVNEDVIKLVPDRDHPIHQGFCCHKGLTFDEIHQDPDRLDYPMRRVNRGSDEEANFERTTWDAAMDDIGEKLRGILDTYGPDAIATYHGNPLAFDSRAFIANAGFSLKLGTTKLFNGATQDCSNKIVAGEYVYGTGSMHPIPDLHNTDYFFVHRIQSTCVSYVLFPFVRPHGPNRGDQETWRKSEVRQSANHRIGVEDWQ